MPQILETAGVVAREAGSLLNEFAQRRIGYELKGEHDLVTAADRASEKLIVERLTNAFPDTRSSPKRAVGRSALRNTVGMSIRSMGQPTSPTASPSITFRSVSKRPAN